MIKVNQGQGANAGAGKIQSNGTAEASKPNDTDVAIKQSLLPFDIDFRQ
jgi:hypothetical protein